MILGLDHLAIAVDDPDVAVGELAAFLGIPEGESGGRHEAWGTRNRLLWLGDTYIELCTVFDGRLAERSWLGRPTLRHLEAGQPAAICWAISTDDIDRDRGEMNAAGAALSEPAAGERRRPDGRIVRWRLALPAAVDLARPFLIQHDPSAAEWTPGDRAERAAKPGRVTSLELPVDAIDGIRGAAAALGSQRLSAMGIGAAPATIRITGVSRAGVRGEVVGCRWFLE